jgi:hypothetical protein
MSEVRAKVIQAGYHVLRVIMKLPLTAAELRTTTEEFRSMSVEGEKLRQEAALLVVANDFEQEAARIDAIGMATIAL